MRNIDLIRQVISASENNWPHVLGCLNINVPDSPRRHAPLPCMWGQKIDSGSMTTGAVASSVISAALVMGWI